jgi:tetratricopeptide (TPR) repeat protein
LTGERECLVAAAVHAAEQGWPGHAIQMASTLFRYVDDGGHYPEAVIIHSCARRAAHLTGDKAAEATALTSLGRALHNLSLVELWLSEYQQASEHFLEALTLFRRNGIRGGEARALGNLGHVDLRQGCYQQAATRYLEQSRGLFRDISEPAGEALALRRLGDVQLKLGRYQEAADHFQQAKSMYRKIGNRGSEADALNGLGEVLLATGQPLRAQIEFATALDQARQIGDLRQQARAHDGLGNAYHAAGQADQASHHCKQAIALHTEVEASEARQVLAPLTQTDEGDREQGAAPD